MSKTGPVRRTWFHDSLTSDLEMAHRVEETLYTGHSAYQSIEVIKTLSFGSCLVLDGKIQSSEADEFLYHETLVHPALIAHPGPRHVLIAGGGEGTTLREVLRHKTVQQATMVDLDEQVVSVCRQWLPSFSAGSFEDPRTELIVGDARKFVEESTKTFDTIIIDLPDPLEVGPAQMLYTREFYSAVRNRLAPGGIIAVQSESSCWYDMEAFAAIVRTLREVFVHVAPYQAHIPCFSGLWGFTAASDTLDPTSLLPGEIDERVARRIAGELHAYDGLTHVGLFALPRHLRSQLEAASKVITDEEPLRVY